MFLLPYYFPFWLIVSCQSRLPDRYFVLLCSLKLYNEILSLLLYFIFLFFIMNNKRKNKRTKVQCLSCDTVFDHYYRRKHELYIHGCSRVKVKYVNVGEINNLFAAARLNFECEVRYLQLHI